MTWRKALVWVRDSWSILGLAFLGLLVLEALALLICLAIPEHAPLRVLEADFFNEADWAGDYVREYRQSEPVSWNSYVYWRRPAFAGKYIHVDERGLRRTWGPESLPDDAKKVFFFGGSAMWGTGARDAHTIPSQVAKILDQKGIAVRCFNFGESGYVSTQELIALALEVRRGNIPDVAVFYDGFNDVVAAYQAGSAGLPQNESDRRIEFNLSRRPGETFWHSAGGLLRRSGLGRLFGRIAGGGDDRFPLLDGEKAARLAREQVEIYQANLRLISALAAEYKFTPLFYWQPTILSKTHKTPYEQTWIKEEDGLLALLDLVNREIQQNRPLNDDPRFCDLSGLFGRTPQGLFADYCHVSEEGNRRVAERMAADISSAISAPGESNP